MAGGGAGFGAGIAEGFGEAFLRNSAETRAKQRREEDRAHEADKFLFQEALTHMHETGDPTAANAMLERLSPDLAKRFKKEGSPLDHLAPMLQRASGQQQRVNQQSYEDAVNAPRDPAGMAAPIYNSGPDRISAGTQPTTPPPTFMGMPVQTPDQRIAQQTSMETQLDAATLKRRQSHLQALAQAGQPLSPQASQEYLLTGKLSPQVLAPRPVAAGRTGGITPAMQFEQYVADKKAERAQQGGAPWGPADTLAARTEWERANDPLKTPTGAKAAVPATPEEIAMATMAVKNPSMMKDWTPTDKGKVMRVIASTPALAAQYEETRGAAIKGAAQITLTALKDLVQVGADGQVTGLTPGAQDLYGTNILGRAMTRYPGSPGARARASLAQITGQQVLDLLASLKSQSSTGATGFGQLSGPELALLEASATRLKSEIGVDGALPLLKDVYDKVRKILAPPPAMPNAGAGRVPAGTEPPATPAASQPGGGAGMPRGGAPAGPAGMVVGPDGKLYLNGQPLP